MTDIEKQDQTEQDQNEQLQAEEQQEPNAVPEPPAQASESRGEKEPSSFHNPINTKHWLYVHLVLMIPIVNIIMMIIWAIGDHPTSAHKRGYARGSLLAILITYVVAFALSFILVSMGMALY